MGARAGAGRRPSSSRVARRKIDVFPCSRPFRAQIVVTVRRRYAAQGATRRALRAGTHAPIPLLKVGALRGAGSWILVSVCAALPRGRGPSCTRARSQTRSGCASLFRADDEADDMADDEAENKAAEDLLNSMKDYNPTVRARP